MVSAQTAAELERVSKFFGIDLELNRHIFRHAATADGRAFELVVRALAQAVEQDIRFGVTNRIRETIARERGKK